MRYTRTKLLALVTVALGVTTIQAQAVNCQGRRDTGTAVGAIGGGLIGNAAGHGNTGSTIAGAVVGGLAGNVIGGSNCEQRRYSRYEPYRAAYYYDDYGYRHYYRRNVRRVGYYYDWDGRMHYYR